MEHTKDLNIEQAAAVMHDKGPALVVAGAGTGKTTVITRRIAWLIATKRAKPEEILALTFTDKAAREMQERVDQLLPYGFVSTNILTFHALGDQILRDNALEIGISTDFKVMSTFQQIIFLQEMLGDLGLDYYAPLGNPYEFLQALCGHFSRLKDECVGPAEYQQFATTLAKKATTPEERQEAARVAELAGAFAIYQAEQRKAGKLDFGDQISLTIELFEVRSNILAAYQSRYKYILVDEYQDTNLAQNRLVKMLSNKHHNIMVVGDDDQSIYRFRGAAITNILGFIDEYPKAKQLVLNQNYRSSQEILDVSYQLITRNNPDRLEVRNNIDKKLVAQQHGPHPELIQTQSLVEEMQAVAAKVAGLIATGIAPKQIAILLRKNKQAAAMMVALEKEGILAESSQRSSLFALPEVKALLNFVAVLSDPKDSAAMYGLLAGDIYTFDLSELARLSAQAHRQRVSLQHYLKELAQQEQQEPRLENALEDIATYQEAARELTIGQLLYKYINEQGYLARLLQEAGESNRGAEKIQHIAHFFGLVTEFESISLDPTVYHFWEYLAKMRASESDILADESPLDQNAVQLMTVHKAKGLEYEAVFMIDLVNEVFPARRMSEKVSIPDGLVDINTSREWHIAEERRLFYVGLTRARTYLYLSCSYDHGGARLRKISPFVAEALGEIHPLELAGKPSSIELIHGFAKPTLPNRDLVGHLYQDGWLHLTPHQVDDYLRDPEKFWLFHVLKLPQGPFHALVYGSAIHHAIEFYFRARLGGKKPTLKQVYKAFEDAWSSEGFVSRSHEEQRLKRGREVIGQFYRQHEADGHLPLMVEQAFSFVLPELKVRIAGRYDAVFPMQPGGALDEGIEIRDFKTSQAKDQSAADRKLKDSIQMAIYALAWEKTTKTPAGSVCLDFVEAGLQAKSSKFDHAKTLAKIEKVAKGIAAGDFRPSGSGIYKIERPW